jgi:transmembrane sensor
LSDESVGLHQLSSPREISARAAQWLIKQYASSAWNVDDQSAFEMWMAESPAHMLAYWRLEAVWGRADRLTALRRPLGATEQPVERRRRIISIIGRSGIGLFLLGALTIGASFYLRPDGSTSYETPLGGHKILVLADGSKIELNTDTLVRVVINGVRRDVWLDKGEAYFQIKHDAAHPFVVRAGNQRITDIGTAFSIRRDADRLQVMLIEGRAKLESDSTELRTKPVVLKPGDVAVATSGGIAFMRKLAPAVSELLAWRRGLLAFDNTPLADVAAEFNRYNREKLIVVGTEARSVGVGGHFRATNLEAFKRIARNILRLHVESHGDETVISR